MSPRARRVGDICDCSADGLLTLRSGSVTLIGCVMPMWLWSVRVRPGLALACGLGLHGLSVRVIDRAQGPATTSRANFLHARGSEVLDRLGALGSLPEDSMRAMRITNHLGNRPVMTLEFGDPGLRTAAPPMVVLQAKVEAALRGRLDDLGTVPEWGRGLARIFNVDAVQRWTTYTASQLWVSYRKGPSAAAGVNPARATGSPTSHVSDQMAPTRDCTASWVGTGPRWFLPAYREIAAASTRCGSAWASMSTFWPTTGSRRCSCAPMDIWPGAAGAATSRG